MSVKYYKLKMVVWSVVMWNDIQRRCVWQIMILFGKQWQSLYSVQSTVAATLKIHKILIYLRLNFTFIIKNVQKPMKGGNAPCISTKYQCHDTVSHKIIYTDVIILFSVSMEETSIKNYNYICIHSNQFDNQHAKNKRRDHICYCHLLFFCYNKSR